MGHPKEATTESNSGMIQLKIQGWNTINPVFCCLVQVRVIFISVLDWMRMVKTIPYVNFLRQSEKLISLRKWKPILPLQTGQHFPSGITNSLYFLPVQSGTGQVGGEQMDFPSYNKKQASHEPKERETNAMLYKNAVRRLISPCI